MNEWMSEWTQQLGRGLLGYTHVLTSVSEKATSMCILGMGPWETYVTAQQIEKFCNLDEHNLHFY